MQAWIFLFFSFPMSNLSPQQKTQVMQPFFFWLLPELSLFCTSFCTLVFHSQLHSSKKKVSPPAMTQTLLYIQKVYGVIAQPSSIAPWSFGFHNTTNNGNSDKKQYVEHCAAKSTPEMSFQQYHEPGSRINSVLQMRKLKLSVGQ